MVKRKQILRGVVRLWVSSFLSFVLFSYLAQASCLLTLETNRKGPIEDTQQKSEQELFLKKFKASQLHEEHLSEAYQISQALKELLQTLSQRFPEKDFSEHHENAIEIVKQSRDYEVPSEYVAKQANIFHDVIFEHFNILLNYTQTLELVRLSFEKSLETEYFLNILHDYYTEFRSQPSFSHKIAFQLAIETMHTETFFLQNARKPIGFTQSQGHENINTAPKRRRIGFKTEGEIIPPYIPNKRPQVQQHQRRIGF